MNRTQATQPQAPASGADNALTARLTAAIDPLTTPPATVPVQNILIGQRPCYRCHTDYWADSHGKTRPPGVWYHTASKSEDPQPIDIWLCGEMHIQAIARDKNGRSFGQVLRFRNKLNHWQTWNMPTRLLAGRSDELLKELLDMGLAVNHQKRAQIAAYISSVTPDKSIWTASQVGWFDGSFVLPDTTIGNGEDSVLFQSESNAHPEYGTAGTLAAWRSQIASLCVGNPLLMFTVATAFAGTLLKPCNMDGIGFHIFGDSSKGKTTGLKLAASVWGEWGKYKRVWKTTANGLEGAAALFNDGLLALDEIGDGDAKDISEALYMIGNGTGKQRANVLGHAQAVRTWRVAVLSNGEKTIEAHLAQKGLTVKAGQLVRFLQIPLSGQHGAFDNLHGLADARTLADTLAKHANHVYGVAGRAYLTQLTQDPDTLTQCPQHLDTALKQIGHRFGELGAQETRAAKAFALVGVAGELATQYGVTGWPEGAALAAALQCFGDWRGYRGEGDTEPQHIKTAVADYIEKFGDARFTSTDDDTRLHGERSGYWREDSQGRQWLLTESGLKEAAKGFDLKQVVEVLKTAGWLIPDSEGKNKRRANFRYNETDKNRFYTLIIGGSTAETATNLAVDSGKL
jgi:putative DNA primase/helicase